MSPFADEVLGASSTSTDLLDLLSDVWKAKVDGSGEVNLRRWRVWRSELQPDVVPGRQPDPVPAL